MLRAYNIRPGSSSAPSSRTGSNPVEKMNREGAKDAKFCLAESGSRLKERRLSIRPKRHILTNC